MRNAPGMWIVPGCFCSVLPGQFDSGLARALSPGHFG